MVDALISERDNLQRKLATRDGGSQRLCRHARIGQAPAHTHACTHNSARMFYSRYAGRHLSDDRWEPHAESPQRDASGSAQAAAVDTVVPTPTSVPDGPAEGPAHESDSHHGRTLVELAESAHFEAAGAAAEAEVSNSTEGTEGGADGTSTANTAERTQHELLAERIQAMYAQASVSADATSLAPFSMAMLRSATEGAAVSHGLGHAQLREYATQQGEVTPSSLTKPLFEASMHVASALVPSTVRSAAASRGGRPKLAGAFLASAARPPRGESPGVLQFVYYLLGEWLFGAAAPAPQVLDR